MIGSSLTLYCTSDLAISVIEWVDNNGKVLRNDTEQVLELTIIVLDDESLIFTCRTMSDFGTQNMTVTINIASNPTSESESIPLGTAAPVIVPVIILVVLIVLVVTTIFIVR